jgi:predicted permease
LRPELDSNACGTDQPRTANASRLRMVILPAAFVLAWLFLGKTTAALYDQYLPGVPDAGRWPVASLPWLLARANTPGRPWNDGHSGIVWTLGVLTLGFPVFMVALVARNRAERTIAWSLTAVLATWAVVTTFRIQYGYVMLFWPEWPHTKWDAVCIVLEPVLWAGGICVLCAVLGRVLRRATAAYPSGQRHSSAG